MNASPDRCFCCQCAHLHGTLIWLRGWRKKRQAPCGERWLVESCSEDAPVETLNSGQVRWWWGVSCCRGWMGRARSRLINEVIWAWGGRRYASSGPLAAGHNTDRCPITMLMIAGPRSDNHIQSFFTQITIRSAHTTDGAPTRGCLKAYVAQLTPQRLPPPHTHTRTYTPRGLLFKVNGCRTSRPSGRWSMRIQSW